MAKTPTPGLRVRVLADKTDGERVKRYHALTGEAFLADPATGEPKPWPVAGLAIEGDAPKQCQIPTSFVSKRKSENLLTLEGERVVHRPGGPPHDEWRVTHTFVHADAIVLHTVDGDVRYRVVHQPDKYVDEREFAPGDRETLPKLTAELDAQPVTPELYAAGKTRVDHFYGLELEG